MPSGKSRDECGLKIYILRGEVMNNFLVVRWFEVLESLLYLFAVQNPGTLGVLQFGHD